MERDNELAGIGGSVKLDEFTDGRAYSVYESAQEYLAQWAKDNAEEQALIAGEPLACIFHKAGFTKAGKLWICFRTPAGKLGVVSISPALAHDIAPDVLKTEPTYKTSPRGLKLYAGEQWTLTAQEVNDRLKEFTVAVRYEECTIGKDGKQERLTVPRLLDLF